MSEAVKRYMQHAPMAEAIPALVKLYPCATQYVLAAEHDRIVSALTEGGRKMQAQVEQLTTERDEADRRAGAAARKLAEEVDSRIRRTDWLRKAKEEAGYHDGTSFDVVWKETLEKAAERDTLRAEVEQFRALAKANAESLGHALRDEKVLLAELEQLRKDAALFRRLRDLPDELLGAPGVPCVAVPDGPKAGRYVSGPDLDAALEAAR